MKKTLGFYLSVLAAVLALVCVFLYGGVSVSNNMVRPLLIASAVISAAVLALTAVKGTLPGGNLMPVVNSVLCMGAIGLATIPVITMIVFVIMGMNDISTIQGYITFAAAALAAWVLNVVSAFMGITKETA